MKKKTKIIIGSAVTLLSVGTLLLTGVRSVVKPEYKTFTTKNSTFKVGVISDTQLPPTEKSLEDNDLYLQNLKKALTVMKNNDVDMILFAGDIGDLGTYFAFETYVSAIDEVFGENKPIVQTIMGNHDYWSKSFLTYRNHTFAYKTVIGSSPWTHYVVNGYHFIGASPNTGGMTMAYGGTALWLDKELKKATAESDGKPVFVMTHNAPLNTTYGSTEWGDSTLDNVLSKYPNAIVFSGHVHCPLLDERSIWQGDYTVLNTQSLSYTELGELDRESGTVPPNAEATPMGYIMEITEDNISIHRMNFADGKNGYEEKSDNVWSFSLPYENDLKYSFENRIQNNTAPVMVAQTATVSKENSKIVLSFDAGEDDDFVHSYKVVIDGEETKYFFSDFYNGIDSMSKTVKIELELPDSNKEHTYEIYAVDSWGAESSSCATVTG